MKTFGESIELSRPNLFELRDSLQEQILALGRDFDSLGGTLHADIVESMRSWFPDELTELLGNETPLCREAYARERLSSATIEGLKPKTDTGTPEGSEKPEWHLYSGKLYRDDLVEIFGEDAESMDISFTEAMYTWVHEMEARGWPFIVVIDCGDQGKINFTITGDTPETRQALASRLLAENDESEVSDFSYRTHGDRIIVGATPGTHLRLALEEAEQPDTQEVQREIAERNAHYRQVRDAGLQARDFGANSTKGSW